MKKFARWGHRASDGARNSLRITGGGVPSRRFLEIPNFFAALLFSTVVRECSVKHALRRSFIKRLQSCARPVR
jgi:hypothetical protein